MRSPARNAVVPSQETSAPLKLTSTSPRRTTAAIGDVASTRVTSTPRGRVLAGNSRLARSAAASAGCHSKPTVGKPVTALPPLRSKSARKCATTGVGTT